MIPGDKVLTDASSLLFNDSEPFNINLVLPSPEIKPQLIVVNQVFNFILLRVQVGAAKDGGLGLYVKGVSELSMSLQAFWISQEKVIELEYKMQV